MSAVIVGTFSWPLLPTAATEALAIIQAIWFSSLVFAVAAVAIALHQRVFLARIAILPRYNELIVDLLTYETSGGHRQPRQEQVLIWLLAVALLEWSIGLWLGGYVVFLWDITKMGQKDQQSLDVMVRWSSSERSRVLTLAVQVASLSVVVLITVVVLYFFSITQLWRRVRKHLTL